MSKVIHSVQLFLEYVIAHPHERDSHTLFVNFAQRLYSGTFDRETGSDPSGLCWMPHSASNARKIIVNLSLFFEWFGESNPRAAIVNPRVRANTYDRYWNELALQYRRDNALLGHLWGEDAKDGTIWAVNASREPTTEPIERPAFPDDRFDELINEGFRVGGKSDYRGILITLLMHGAGFRESEPFHLYIEDVIPDPKAPQTALVRIHHPSNGFAPAGYRDSLGRRRKVSRAEYLAEKFGLLPRHKLFGTRKAGWKGGLHDGEVYKEAFWFQPVYGEQFLEVWMRYLHQVAKVSRAHPFALINLGREPIGEMYSLAHFNKAHAAACKRIGLEVRKELGTTPHGHRHAYGQRLAKAGVDEMSIRRCMHHTSPDSQVIYTQPGLDEIRKELGEASKKLPQNAPLVLSDLERQ